MLFFFSFTFHTKRDTFQNNHCTLLQEKYVNMLRTFLPIARNASCQIVRYYRSKDQAGIRRQNKIYRDPNVVKSFEEDPEITFDADFTQLHQSHRDHEQEMELRKEQTKYYTIKSRYFKTEKQPNMLTWAEKEQIRHLNETDPDEWTPERLAESFPAVEEVIIKILQAKWKPRDMQRIQKHDEHVKRNWQLFKTNQLPNLDPDVKMHLKKFSNRNFDTIQNAYMQRSVDDKFEFPKPKSTEYLQIVSSCQRKKDEKNAVTSGESNAKIEQKPDEALKLISKPALKLSKSMKSMRREQMTYDQLFASTSESNPKLNEPQDTQTNVSLLKDSDTIPSDGTEHDAPPTDTRYTDLDESQNESNVVDLTPNQSTSSSQIVQKYATKTSSLEKFSKDMQAEPFQSKIQIPHNLRKRGSLYQLYDCFYDDTGEFLYRVPGLRI